MKKKCFKSNLHVFVNFLFRKTALKFTVLILLHTVLSRSSVELTFYTEIFNQQIVTLLAAGESFLPQGFNDVQLGFVKELDMVISLLPVII